MNSVLTVLERWADRQPDQILYSFLDHNGFVLERHTYGSFLQRVNVIAGHLSDRKGLKVGDRVLLVYPPGLEMIASLFACARVGLIPVPVPAPNAYGLTGTLHRLRHITQDCGASTVLTSRDSRSRWQQLIDANDGANELATYPFRKVKWIVTSDLPEPHRAYTKRDPHDVFLLQYTSGSTSSPRGVVVTHANVLHNCRLAVDHEAPITVSWLPQHHDMGLLGYYIYIALTGGTTYGFSPTSFIQRPALWLETISKYRASASSAPNFAFEYCVRPNRVSDATLAGLNLSSVRYLMAAAEPIRPDTYRNFLQRFEPQGLRRQSFFVAYGLAENTLIVTNYGRSTISVSSRALANGVARRTSEVSGVGSATHLISCGRPLTGITVRIVHPERRVVLPDGEVGEIWVRGESTCPGYWNKPEVTREVFCATLLQDGGADDGPYLRTGDLGFFDEGELYVCGRRKDMIIVRGQNYFPQDIEAIVQRASPQVRCVVAFGLEGEQYAPIGVVAETGSRESTPDCRTIAAAIRDGVGVEIGVIAFVRPKSIPRTSSGKLVRHLAKSMWLAGEFSIIEQFSRAKVADSCANASPLLAPLTLLRERYHLTGRERHSLLEAGMDSVDLVIFLHELQELLAATGANILSRQIDFRLIQRVSVAEVFAALEQFERAPNDAIEQLRHIIGHIRQQHRAEEQAMMIVDRKIGFAPTRPCYPCQDQGISTGTPRVVLLTGGTGFLGPFLLRSLLQQTDATIHVIVRGSSVEEAGSRLRAVFQKTVEPSPSLSAMFERRIVPACGDLEKRRLGLDTENWSKFAHAVDTIYHNAASVNYLFNYSSMRAANVTATEEILRLAFAESPKIVNHISTTFIFGWATKAVLLETDSNADMELLDFGYSQTKWVSEQKVLDAARYGLRTRIFRPSLITPSAAGSGNNIDITVRLISFMIKHGIGVDTQNHVSFVPADVTANNIVAIANRPCTTGQTFHVTRDQYANMVDVMRIIGGRTGRVFQFFPLREFVPEVIRRCTKEDLLFPLLDFLIGSVENISAMEFKRYDNSAYREARDGTSWGTPDLSLDATVDGLLSYMKRNHII